MVAEGGRGEDAIKVVANIRIRALLLGHLETNGGGGRDERRGSDGGRP
jgi:hypothetical protein